MTLHNLNNKSEEGSTYRTTVQCSSSCPAEKVMFVCYMCTSGLDHLIRDLKRINRSFFQNVEWCSHLSVPCRRDSHPL